MLAQAIATAQSAGEDSCGGFDTDDDDDAFGDDDDAFM